MALELALLWIESLALALVFTAWETARAARGWLVWPRWGPVLGSLAGVGLPLGVGAGATTLAWLMAEKGFPTHALPWCGAWTAAYLLAATGLGWSLSRRAGGLFAAARTWSIPRLTRWGYGATMLLLLTFLGVDASVCHRLEHVRAESATLALSVAPTRVEARDNAAPLYDAAIAAMGRPQSSGSANEWPTESEAWLDQAREAVFDAEQPGLADFLASREGAIAQLRHAAALPACVFERDYARPSFDMMLPELAGLRLAAKLLALSARWNAAKGRMRPAIADVAAMFGIADHLHDGDPLLISWLVGAAIRTLGARTLVGVLHAGPVSEQDLDLLDLEGRASSTRSLARALRMEEAFGLGAFAEFGRSSSSVIYELRIFPAPLIPIWRVLMLESDLAAYRDGLKQAQTLAAQPYMTVRAQWTELDQDTPGRGGVVSRLLLPALSHSAQRAAELEAVSGLCRLAVATARYRARNGFHPAQAEDLVPECLAAVPRDPFDPTGKPLRWCSDLACDEEAHGYSIGPNGVDDGGREDRNDTNQGDIALVLSVR